MKKLISVSAFVVACVCTQDVCGDIRVWDGGGANDNFSTAANWVGDVAPGAGDTLVFMGSTRTSPVNDLNVQFGGIVFSNTASTCNAPFTLKGDPIHISYGPAGAVPGVSQKFGIWPMSGSGSLTDTIEADIIMASSQKLGCYSAGGHNLIFKGAVTGTGTLQTMDQYKAGLTFEGPVTGFSYVLRPNGGGGTVTLKSPENSFSGTTHSIGEGGLTISSAGALGGAEKNVTLGQASWNTPASLTVNATSDTLLSGNITVRGPLYTANAGSIANAVKGTTLTLAGKLLGETAANTATYGASAGLGVGVSLGGAGDGCVAGSIETPFLWLNKTGTGTWTFAPESTCAATGTLTVADGTLVVNGDYSSLAGVTVNAGKTLAGTGRVARVTFADGTIYRLTQTTDGFRSLQIDNGILLNGTLKIAVDPAPTLEAGREYTLFTCSGGIAGNGRCVPGEGLPGAAVLTVKSDRVTMTIASEQLVWLGDADNNVWDNTTPNWQNGKVFANGMGVAFDDSAAAGATDVVLAAGLEPQVVMVRSSQKNYTFSGAGITGFASLDKSAGTSVLTLANDNTYTGDTTIDSGALVLSGSLSGSQLTVGANGAFTNTPSGRISGPVKVIVSNGRCELSGTNDFTGGLYVTAPYVESSNTTVTALNAAALGAGNVTLQKGTLLVRGAGGATGRGRTFDAVNSPMLYIGAGSSFTWQGDVTFHGSQLNLRTDGSLTLGAEDGSTTIRSLNGAGIYVRQSGILHLRSRLDVGYYHQTDYNTTHFYATGNKWNYMLLQASGVICHATNTLGYGELRMGQVYEAYKFHPSVDLNGFDQTISWLRMMDSNDGSSQTVKSSLPAVLTVSNDVDTVTERRQLKITGKVTLRKAGAGDWSFAGKNETTGDFLVDAGTLTVAAADALPTASEDSRLVVQPNARVVLADGVNATVSRLSNGRVELPAGVYGGEGCTAAGAHIRPNIFGAGTGSLRVLHGNCGMSIILR